MTIFSPVTLWLYGPCYVAGLAAFIIASGSATLTALKTAR